MKTVISVPDAIQQRPIEELLKLKVYTDLSEGELETLLAWTKTEITNLEQDKAEDPKGVDYIEGVKKNFRRAVFVEESAARIQMAILDLKEAKPYVSSEVEKARENMLVRSQAVQGLASPLSKELLVPLINEHQYKLPKEKKNIINRVITAAGASSVTSVLFRISHETAQYTPAEWAMIVGVGVIVALNEIDDVKKIAKELCLRMKDEPISPSQEQSFSTHGWSQSYYLP